MDVVTNIFVSNRGRNSQLAVRKPLFDDNNNSANYNEHYNNNSHAFRVQSIDHFGRTFSCLLRVVFLYQ